MRRRYERGGRRRGRRGRRSCRRGVLSRWGGGGHVVSGSRLQWLAGGRRSWHHPGRWETGAGRLRGPSGDGFIPVGGGGLFGVAIGSCGGWGLGLPRGRRRGPGCMPRGDGPHRLGRSRLLRRLCGGRLCGGRRLCRLCLGRHSRRNGNALQPITFRPAPHPVRLGFLDARGVALHPDAHGKAEVKTLLVRQTELACQLVDPDFSCQSCLSVPFFTARPCRRFEERLDVCGWYFYTQRPGKSASLLCHGYTLGPRQARITELAKPSATARALAVEHHPAVCAYHYADQCSCTSLDPAPDAGAGRLGRRLALRPGTLTRLRGQAPPAMRNAPVEGRTGGRCLSSH